VQVVGEAAMAAARKIMRSSRRDMGAYFALLEEAANSGHPEALEQLGMWYVEGFSDEVVRLKRNFRKAKALLELASKGGSAIASGRLGYFYDVGEGGTENKDLAISYYRRAVRLGHAFSALNLATIYRDRGNYQRQRWWLLRALGMGEPQAAIDLGVLAVQRNARGAPWVRKTVEALRRVARGRSPEDAEEARALLNELGARA
jgi:TPR repeat protein